MATEQKETSDPCAKYNEQTNFLSKTIFASRWLQVPILLRFNCRARHLCLQVYEKLVVFSSPMLMKWMRTPYARRPQSH